MCKIHKLFFCYIKFEFWPPKNEGCWRERIGLGVLNDMFRAAKHIVWVAQTIPLARRKLSFHKMKNEKWWKEEWKMKREKPFLHNLTSLSSLFPDKILLNSLIAFPGLILITFSHFLIQFEQLCYALAFREGGFDGESVCLHYGAVVILMGFAEFNGHGQFVV